MDFCYGFSKHIDFCLSIQLINFCYGCSKHIDFQTLNMFVVVFLVGLIVFGNGHFIAVMPPKFLKSFVTLELLIKVIPSHSNVTV